MSDQTKQPIASEQGHFYRQDGSPCYEVPRAKGDGTRPTTIADARKLGLVPSVTLITRVAAAPGLEAWKAKQLLESALTLPRIEGETLDDYSKRVIEDSQAQSLKAREQGTSLHAAIEHYIGGIITPEWDSHLAKLDETLTQYGIDIRQGKAEHCFASSLGFGGKLDFHNDEVLIDFKTTAAIGAKKQLAWPEHVWQLAAYRQGIEGRQRLLNVFIGCEDCEVRIVEWTPEDAAIGWRCFDHLLRFWYLKNKFGGNNQ